MNLKNIFISGDNHNDRFPSETDQGRHTCSSWSNSFMFYRGGLIDNRINIQGWYNYGFVMKYSNLLQIMPFENSYSNKILIKQHQLLHSYWKDRATHPLIALYNQTYNSVTSATYQALDSVYVSLKEAEKCLGYTDYLSSQSERDKEKKRTDKAVLELINDYIEDQVRTPGKGGGKKRNTWKKPRVDYTDYENYGSAYDTRSKNTSEQQEEEVIDTSKPKKESQVEKPPDIPIPTENQAEPKKPEIPQQEFTLNADLKTPEVKKARFGRYKILTIAIARMISDEDLDIVLNFMPEMAILDKKNKRTADLKKVFKVLETSNEHDVLATLRKLAIQLIAQQIRYDYWIHAINETVDCLLDVDIWSVAANYKRMSSITRYLYSENPSLDPADEIRNDKNKKFLERNPDMQVNTTNRPINIKDTDWNEEFKNKSSTRAISNHRIFDRSINIEKEIKDGKITEIKGDGWCWLYATGTYLKRKHKIENDEPMEILAIREIANPDTVLLVSSDRKTQVTAGFLLNMFLSDRTLYNDYKNSADFVKQWGDNKDLKPGTVQTIAMDIFTPKDKDGRQRIYFSDEDLDHIIQTGMYNMECLLHIDGNHYDLIYGEIEIAAVERIIPRTKVIGVHIDVHYFIEVFRLICIKSRDFPQYIAGWSMPEQDGYYVIPHATVEVQNGMVEFKPSGNSSVPAYKHANFSLGEDNTKIYEFDQKQYHLAVLRKVKIGVCYYFIGEIKAITSYYQIPKNVKKR